MALAVVYSRAAVGLEAPLVTVEVNLAGGLPSLTVVGLPEAAVRESKDRVRAAVINSGFDFPARRITVNLAPADLPKDGGRFDLPIAIGILAASGQLTVSDLTNYEFLGELSLGGELRPVTALLPSALAVRSSKRRLVVPVENSAEAGLAKGSNTALAATLCEVFTELSGQSRLPEPEAMTVEKKPHAVDMSEVKGQPIARRALEIAAAGGHSLLFCGPPGSGKSMLAARLPTILPPLSETEALEVASVASIGHTGFDATQFGHRPFRSPHHTASGVALVGGGGNPRPGEITLAHNGVLFLDELPEFDRRVLEVLREPLESGRICISRAARQAEYPARFQLIAAMNPCPCGYLGDSAKQCRCTAEQVQRYRSKISGPLMDRIDMHCLVGRVEKEALDSRREEESSAIVRRRVFAARELQAERGVTNAVLSVDAIERYCQPDAQGQGLLEQAFSRLGLSARAYHRVLRLARTIADLSGEKAISSKHVAEAIGFRQLDRLESN